MANTSRGIWYPTTSDSVRPASRDFKDLAFTTTAAIDEAVAEANPYRGTLPYGTDLADVPVSGVYTVPTFAWAQSITAPQGPLPVLSQGRLEVTYMSNTERRGVMVWSPTDDTPWQSTNTGGGWRPWEPYKEEWVRGELPNNANLDNIDTSGIYTVPTFSRAQSITGPQGPLPVISAGVLQVVFTHGNADRGIMFWYPTDGMPWQSVSTGSGWRAWQEIGADGPHNWDQRYYTKPQVDAIETALQHAINAAESAAKTYTDTAFEASGPGGATDEQLDAAIDRAILSGRLNVGTTVNPASHGAVADGTTDDAAALQAAMTEAQATGKPVEFAAGSIYRIDDRLDVPQGVKIIGNNARILAGQERNDFTVRFSHRSQVIGHLTVEGARGSMTTRGVALDGTDILVDSLTVTHDEPGAGYGDGNQTGCLIRGNRIHIRSLRVHNFDYSVNLEDSTAVDIGQLDIENYIRGLWIRRSKYVNAAGRIYGTSPNDGPHAGYNGVLMDSRSAHDDISDIHLDGIVVEDAGEHGFRLGGTTRTTRIRFNHCISRNSGQGGFKVLSTPTGDNTFRDEDVIFTGCIVEDAGDTPQNAAGFLIHYARNVQIVAPIVRRVNKQYSAGSGIEIQGSTNVQIVNPIIEDPLLAGLTIYDNREEVQQVRLAGGLIRAPYAVRMELVNFAPGTLMRDIYVTDTRVEGNALHVSKDTTTIENLVLGVEYTGTVGDGDFTGVVGNLVGEFDETKTLEDGSTWRTADGTTRLRSNGQWVTQ